MGNFSTFYFLNFNSIITNNADQVDSGIESFNYLFDSGLIKEKSPRKNLVKNIVNHTKVTCTLKAGNFDYLEFGNN